MKTYDLIDATNVDNLRYRRILRIGRFRIPISRWVSCGPFRRGPHERYAKYHCDMCEKYSGWRD